MRECKPPLRPASYDKKIAQYLPDWVAGISIGAINAASLWDRLPEDVRKTPEAHARS